MAVGLFEMTSIFDVTKVIMIYSSTKRRFTKSYTTQLPKKEQRIQFNIFL
jgi:hypothetical protein